MPFVTISNIRPLPSPGAQFRMVASEHLDKDGNLKPGREDKPFPVTVVRINPKTNTVFYTRDENPDDDPQPISVESVSYKVESATGGRRRGRTMRRRASRKTRRGRKH